MDIALNFINNSNDANNSQIVIFQPNVADDHETAVAWHVIEHCGQNEHHPFTYPATMHVSSSDAWGNYTPLLAATPGQAFAHSMTASGDTLGYLQPSTNPAQVQVLNALPQGAINASIYKNGRLLATRTSVAPAQQASFEFKPALRIGVASGVETGDIMDAAIVSSLNTELSLTGVASADIVMTGGGAGPEAMPFSFMLANIVMA